MDRPSESVLQDLLLEQNINSWKALLWLGETLWLVMGEDTVENTDSGGFYLFW